MEGGEITSIGGGADGSKGTIFSLVVDQSGQIWAGSSDMGTFYKWDGDEREVVQMQDLGRERIYGLGEDRQGRMWIGGSDTEVTYKNLAPGKYCFSARAMDRDGLISEPVSLKIEITADAQNERIQALEQALQSAEQPLISKSPSLQKTMENVSLVADTDMTVLILGETGTGKGLMGRTIHSMSSRREKPFIQLNCGAIPENLVESELFGHEKGAFTGAVARKIGHFELAHGGTLFLDEIGDLPIESQRVLLNILDDNRLTRVGGGQSIPVNVRVLAATNRDLRKAIRERTFREDLFFRLSGYAIDLPPLRQRREDIPSLVDYFVQQYARHLNRPVPALGLGVIGYLQGYSWPGNVRELEHLLQRAILVCKDNTIQIDDLPLLMDQPELAVVPGADSGGRVSLEEQEKQSIIGALKTTNWIIYGERGAAKLLGIHPEKLRSRMRKYGLRRPKKPSPNPRWAARG